jgi:exopolysaccharide biosynthesis protein
MMPFPALLAPPSPFPRIVTQSATADVVAPGIRREDLHLVTSDGPLVVHVVAIDPSEPTVRLGAVVAHDRMISAGETVSSMAARTQAVAGINADYFDITNTNQPLNIVVQNGVLERTPSKRVALWVGSTGVAMGNVAFAGSFTDGAMQLPLTTVNEWPPQGGVALVTAAYGALTALPGVQLAQLAPIDTTAGLPGAYRVTAVGPATAGPVTGVALGFGPAALARSAPPAVGDVVHLAFDTTPAAAGMIAAVGGGPLLVANGSAVDDPNSPAPEERNVRFPVAGAARTAAGTLLLLVVDGRHAAVSIGLTRPQFGALMLGFGAIDGMAFDSGGSATLVARVLGDAQPTVRNDPSDGVERPVADGLFAYSDAPVGVDPHLVVRPATFAALAGASVPLRAAIVDDAGHRLRAATVAPVVADAAPGDHVAVVRDPADAASVPVPYRTVDRLASLAIVPDHAHAAPGEPLTLMLAGTDERGQPVDLGAAAVAWTIDRAPRVAGPRLAYDTLRGDGTVTAALAGATATLRVRVGSHTIAIPTPEIELPYDLTGSARVAAAPQSLDLPDEPLSFSLEAFGDASGVPLRVAFVNRYGERHALTLAKHVDWMGWRRLAVALPPDLNPPIRLVSLYVVPSLGGPPVHAAGALRFRGFAVVVPGMP